MNIGESYASLQYLYRIPRQTIARIVPDTCSVITEVLSDDSFPLKEYIQKPFGQVGLTTEKRTVNYRLSRARCIVENRFGILANRFRVFMAPIHLSPEKAEVIVMACCSLHNFLFTKKNSNLCSSWKFWQRGL